MDHVLKNIKKIRQQKGYSHEYLALELNISQAAYSKLEKSETKLTIDRLYKIAEILEAPIVELLDENPNTEFNQKNHDNAIGYQQQIENYHHENKEKTEKIIQLYEERIQDKNVIIDQLQQLLKNN